MKTWVGELIVAGVILLSVAAWSGDGVEFIGAAAVLLALAHAQVADRLAEREEAREVRFVDCFRWAKRYLVSKEALWLLYFVCRGAWAPLVGVAIFLSYPVWRRCWRRRFPLQHAEVC